MKRSQDPQIKELKKAYKQALISSLKRRWPIYGVLLIGSSILSANCTYRSDSILALTVGIALINLLLWNDSKQSLKALRAHYKQMTPKAERRRQQILGIVYLSVGIAVAIALGTMRHNETINSPGSRTTIKNSFMSGCRGQLSSTMSDAKKEQYCSCAFGALEQIHGNQIYTESFSKEIIDKGLPRTDTDAIATNCLAIIKDPAI
jgi:hypothetical protein